MSRRACRNGAIAPAPICSTFEAPSTRSPRSPARSHKNRSSVARSRHSRVQAAHIACVSSLIGDPNRPSSLTAAARAAALAPGRADWPEASALSHARGHPSYADSAGSQLNTSRLTCPCQAGLSAARRPEAQTTARTGPRSGLDRPHDGLSPAPHKINADTWERHRRRSGRVHRQGPEPRTRG